MNPAIDRISGVISLGIGAWFHVTDQYVHVIGNEIINNGFNSRVQGGSWELLNASMFGPSKAWMIIFILLGVILLMKSIISERQQMKSKSENKAGVSGVDNTPV